MYTGDRGENAGAFMKNGISVLFPEPCFAHSVCKLHDDVLVSITIGYTYAVIHICIMRWECFSDFCSTVFYRLPRFSLHFSRNSLNFGFYIPRVLYAMKDSWLVRLSLVDEGLACGTKLSVQRISFFLLV